MPKSSPKEMIAVSCCSVALANSPPNLALTERMDAVLRYMTSRICFSVTLILRASAYSRIPPSTRIFVASVIAWMIFLSQSSARMRIAREIKKSPTSMLASEPHFALTVSLPRLTVVSSTTSSCKRVAA